VPGSLNASRQSATRLSGADLAEAALLGDLALVLAVGGWFLPFGTLILAAAAVPVALLAARRRVGAVVVGSLAAALLSIVVAGLGLALEVAVVALIGAVVGVSMRRGWGSARSVMLAVVGTWVPLSALSLALMAVFASLRRLALDEVRHTWGGVANLLGRAGHATGLHGLLTAARALKSVEVVLVRHWVVTVPVAALVGIVVLAVLARTVALPALHRLETLSVPQRVLSAGSADEQGPPGPLPVELRRVTVRFGDAHEPVLDDVDLRLEPGQLTMVVGRNGAGKTTLLRVLAGAAPTSGEVWRPGSVGLGRPGGTAIVFQRPESQVLGARVADDVRFGLGALPLEEVERALAEVGLAGFSDRETSTLSGGELQRLAVAAALARHPALLLSDESTSMLDPDGRAALVATFRRLARSGMGVVHVTHRQGELAVAERVLQVGGSKVCELGPSGAGRALGIDRPPGGTQTRPRPAWRPRALRLVGVGHVYAPGTPWQRRALEGVDLELDRGESVLVVGGNGSGKSTLAWILAGLLHPSEGRLEWEEVVRRRGCAIAFQHARLQLLRPTVAEELRALAGTTEASAALLEQVGLDPAEVLTRQVDALSGGEQRRVVLAGILAARPGVLVLDEPLAGLDPPSRASLVDVLVTLRERGDLTLVIVTHDVEDAERLGDRMVRLDRGHLVASETLGAPRRTRIDGSPVQPSVLRRVEGERRS